MRSLDIDLTDRAELFFLHRMAAEHCLLIIYIFISFLILSCNSQTCEPYSLDITSSSLCVGRFNYPVYVPENQTQTQAYKPILDQLYGGQMISGTGFSGGLLKLIFILI